MRKLVVSVIPFVLLVALVLFAQTPDAAGPGGKAPAATGPDAVALNLVNTVCASCHTLERVNNKKGDVDAWTTTVTRMKEKGANFTGEQIPLLAQYLTKAAGAFTVTPAAGRGGAKGGGKGGAKGPATPFSAGGAAVVSASNLKVLTAENVEYTMQNITFALGVGCIYCHDLSNLALDTKPKKGKALMMLEMVRDINAKFGDGKVHVTCWTCHRASTEPQVAKPDSK
jgi:hypothetical protein